MSLPPPPFTLLPPPTHPTSHSSSNNRPSKRVKKAPRPVGEPRPPTSSSRSTLLRATQLQSPVPRAPSSATSRSSTSENVAIAQRQNRQADENDLNDLERCSQESDTAARAHRSSQDLVGAHGTRRDPSGSSARASSRESASGPSRKRRRVSPRLASDELLAIDRDSARDSSTPSSRTSKPSHRSDRPIPSDSNPASIDVSTSTSPHALSLLGSTSWTTLDPYNAYHLLSSRLFQLSQIELGPVTYEQSSAGLKGRYGVPALDEKGKMRRFDRDKEKRAKQELGRLESARLGGTTTTGKVAEGRSSFSEAERERLDRAPSWARTSGTGLRYEWDERTLERLAARLAARLRSSDAAHASRAPSSSTRPDSSFVSDTSACRTNEPSTSNETSLNSMSFSTMQSRPGLGEDLIPVLWASDVVASLRPARLGADSSVECWIVGNEFPCRKAVVVGWVVEREWKDRDQAWIYTIDDGTAMLEVLCEFHHSPLDPDPTRLSRPLADPIKYLAPLARSETPRRTPTAARATSPAGSRSQPPRASYATLADSPPRSLEHETRSVDPSLVLPIDSLVRVVGSIREPKGTWDKGRKLAADRIEVIGGGSVDVSGLTASGSSWEKWGKEATVSASTINYEASHHLLVSTLHREVYDRPSFDLRAVLDRMDRETKVEKKRRVEIEEEERQRKRATQNREPPGSSPAASSEFGDSSVGSIASSSRGSRPTRYRPTRPSKLLPQDLTLTNFIIYIRHHLLKRYVERLDPDDRVELELPPSGQSTSGSRLPSPNKAEGSNRILEGLHKPPFGSDASAPWSDARDASDSDSDDPDSPKPRPIEWTLPFTIASLRSNSHLELFATRWTRERLKLERDRKRRVRERLEREGGFVHLEAADDSTRTTRASHGSSTRARVWVPWEQEGGRGGAVKEDRQRVQLGSARLVNFLPPPRPSGTSGCSSHPDRLASSGAIAGRVSRRRDNREEESDDEMDEKDFRKEVRKSWDEALRHMAKYGMVVEAVAGETEAEADKGRRRNAPKRGDRFATVDRRRSSKPLPDEPFRQSTGRCPWGSPKVPGSSPEDSVEVGTVEATPRKATGTGGIRLGTDDTPRASARTSSNTSGAATAKTGQTGSTSSSIPLKSQSFQLVTPLSLAPFVLSMLEHLESPSSANPASSSRSRTRPPRSAASTRIKERDIRTAMFTDERWSRVAMYSEAVGKALQVLERSGEVERVGEGWSVV